MERACTHPKKSGILKVAVCLRKNYPPAVTVITGTRFAAVSPAQKYMTVKNTPYKAMGGREYSNLLDASHAALSGPPSGGASTRGTLAKVLLHDRDPSHRSRAAAATCDRLGLKNVMLPTHCLDLTPHDATFLGCVKNAWELRCCEGKLNWLERQRLFLSMLNQQDPNPHIERWERVLQACIDKKGEHIECRIKRKLK